MSLRFKLVALFAAVLAATMGVASWLGGRIAQTSIETEIRERTLETGRAFVADLGRAAAYDARSTNERLAQLLRSHRGFRAVELAIERPGADQITRIELAPNGTRQETREGQADVPAKPAFALVDSADGRQWAVSLPARVGRSRGRVTLEASLAEADRLVAAERRIFLWVTAGACGVLVFLVHLMLLRIIGRPIEALAGAMRKAERGQLDVSVSLTSQDELATLAHGFNAMIARIGGFNRELQERIDQAVADLARKNRDLEELNDLLVAARRDLTAKERLAALGQLAGTLAHELGNPLNAISGHVQLLARAPDVPEAARQDLQLVQSEVARMTGIIRRFLDSTRAMTPKPEPVDVPALFNEALDLSLSAEARTRIRVHKDVAEGLGAVVLDPGLVRHVLTNFIANAVDAMPEGGDLHVGASLQGAEIALSVKDTGRGVAPE
ncbi:MAG: HAMP domain-containing protein, partial [Deltaproteobacteria bacterium]|nr:HAMP domain-containing protein [Deltaproteobacteria bacterium]